MPRANKVTQICHRKKKQQIWVPMAILRKVKIATGRKISHGTKKHCLHHKVCYRNFIALAVIRFTRSRRIPNKFLLCIKHRDTIISFRTVYTSNCSLITVPLKIPIYYQQSVKGLWLSYLSDFPSERKKSDFPLLAVNTASVKINEDIPETYCNRKFFTWHIFFFHQRFIGNTNLLFYL